MKRRVFFVDKRGNEISDESIDSHAALAMKILKQNKDITNKDIKKAEDVLKFIQETNGYLMGSSQGEYKRIVFDSSIISEEQKALLRGYYEEGYSLNDIYLEKLKSKKVNGKDEESR